MSEYLVKAAALLARVESANERDNAQNPATLREVRLQVAREYALLTAIEMGAVPNPIPAGHKDQDAPTISADTDDLVTRARDLIASGALPPDPSASALRRALRVGTNAARLVRDKLRGLDR